MGRIDRQFVGVVLLCLVVLGASGLYSADHAADCEARGGVWVDTRWPSGVCTTGTLP